MATRAHDVLLQSDSSKAHVERHGFHLAVPHSGNFKRWSPLGGGDVTSGMLLERLIRNLAFSLLLSVQVVQEEIFPSANLLLLLVQELFVLTYYWLSLLL